MKNMITLAVLALMSAQSYAASVKSAQLSDNGENILIGVQYSGGCKPHEFKLEVSSCLETLPLECEAKLVDKTKDDMCMGIISKKIAISIEESGLKEEYYSGAFIRILGDKDFMTGKPTEATITLPR